ncbi:hypothetical protein YC2023_110047 [Brassica napus]
MAGGHSSEASSYILSLFQNLRNSRFWNHNWASRWSRIGGVLELGVEIIQSSTYQTPSKTIVFFSTVLKFQKKKETNSLLYIEPGKSSSRDKNSNELEMLLGNPVCFLPSSRKSTKLLLS